MAADAPLTAKSTVGAWLDHPIGGALIRALLAEGGAAFVSTAHERGLLVYTWTLRPENAFLEPEHRGDGGPGDWGRWQDEFREVLATGVDGVFADHPDLVVSLLAEEV